MGQHAHGGISHDGTTRSVFSAVFKQNTALLVFLIQSDILTLRPLPTMDVTCARICIVGRGDGGDEDGGIGHCSTGSGIFRSPSYHVGHDLPSTLYTSWAHCILGLQGSVKWTCLTGDSTPVQVRTPWSGPTSPACGLHGRLGRPCPRVAT
jgi:hypothetical protein